MGDISVLIGGKAGFGIDRASLVIANLLSRSGYHIYVYRDYPSLIRGGHTFSIIRASDKRLAVHTDAIDYILALNKETMELHKARLKKTGVIIYDSGAIKPEELPKSIPSAGLPVDEILKSEKASEIVRNTCFAAAFAKSAAMPWELVVNVIRGSFDREIEENLKVARRSYDESKELLKITRNESASSPMPLVTGNEALALGLLSGGLDSYFAYPMTPSSGILHFLAQVAPQFFVKAVHPESEIAVIMMALGSSYCGERTAVGTSGGGFCLMTEGLSFAAMAELPITIILGQRTGPSTGLPTYTGQSELNFALSAGHGDFSRFVVAPGDAEEAFYWARASLDISAKFQIPSIILTDKTLAEGTFNFDIGSISRRIGTGALLWDGQGQYRRYFDAESGISPLAFVPRKGVVVKANSYEHDEYGITTEDPVVAKKMQEKRLRKKAVLARELEDYPVVNVYGKADAGTAVLTWGSNKWACFEAAREFGLKVIQVAVMEPFPYAKLRDAMKGVEKLITVENNVTGQLAGLIECRGMRSDKKILKFDGRPFSIESLKKELKGVL